MGTAAAEKKSFGHKRISQWGYYAAQAKPVVTVRSGELVTINTMVGIPDMLEELGAAVDDPIGG